MNSKQTNLLNFYKKNNNDDIATSSVLESVDDIIASPPKKKKKGTFVRNYNDDYVKYGFICFSSGSNDIPKPQCVLCSVILSNEAMKPAKLIRHLESKHKEFNNKPIDFFIRKGKELTSQKKVMSTTFSSAYLCEVRFSGMTHIKTKTRNRLDATHSLRVSLTTSV